MQEHEAISYFARIGWTLATQSDGQWTLSHHATRQRHTFATAPLACAWWERMLGIARWQEMDYDIILSIADALPATRVQLLRWAREEGRFGLDSRLRRAYSSRSREGPLNAPIDWEADGERLAAWVGLNDTAAHYARLATSLEAYDRVALAARTAPARGDAPLLRL